MKLTLQLLVVVMLNAHTKFGKIVSISQWRIAKANTLPVPKLKKSKESQNLMLLPNFSARVRDFPRRFAIV